MVHELVVGMGRRLVRWLEVEKEFLLAERLGEGKVPELGLVMVLGLDLVLGLA
jgi:hypothetical protein